MSIRKRVFEAGGVSGALLRVCSFDLDRSDEEADNEDTPRFQIRELSLPLLDTAEKVERATIDALLNAEGVSRVQCSSMADGIQRAVQLLRSLKFYGPYIAFCRANFDLLYSEIETVRSDLLPLGVGVLVQTTLDVVRMVSLPDRIVPQVRCDMEGVVGVVVLEVHL